MTKDSLRSAEFNLFLAPSDTELTEFIEEAMALGGAPPGLCNEKHSVQHVRRRKPRAFSTHYPILRCIPMVETIGCVPPPLRGLKSGTFIFTCQIG